jgi:hypothetical protein
VAVSLTIGKLLDLSMSAARGASSFLTKFWTTSRN